MGKLRNLKLNINENQLINDVVNELKNKGYWIASSACDSNQAWCFEDGRVLLVERMGTAHFPQCVKITLTELKELV